jgi:hypothetical protein
MKSSLRIAWIEVHRDFTFLISLRWVGLIVFLQPHIWQDAWNRANLVEHWPISGESIERLTWYM